MKTVNRMKLLAQKNDSNVNASVPIELKKMVVEQSESDNMNVSQFIKMALIEKLERDIQVQ